MYENIIIIPYRDRETHLNFFITNIVPLIEKYMPSTKILVIEQDIGKQFNRGKILNIAFKECKNKTKFFITHDIDIVPSESIVKDIYTKDDIDIFRIFSAHHESFGGILKIKHDTIYNINGFPNNIWGWGIEDRALYYRVYIKKLNYTNNYIIKPFTLLPHKSNATTYKNEKLEISNKWRKEYIDMLTLDEQEKMITNSGINNVDYKIIETKKLHNIVELIKVQI